eukprot:1136722-Pelagomonas_calceolata.AAC.7
MHTYIAGNHGCILFTCSPPLPESTPSLSRYSFCSRAAQPYLKAAHPYLKAYPESLPLPESPPLPESSPPLPESTPSLSRGWPK